MNFKVYSNLNYSGKYVHNRSFGANNEKEPSLITEYINILKPNNNSTTPATNPVPQTTTTKPVTTNPTTTTKPVSPKPPLSPYPRGEMYKLGGLKDGARIVDKENVSEKALYSPKKQPCDYAKGKLEYEQGTKTINGEINNFMQAKRGDCYLLSSLYSIASTKNGKEILKKNFEYNNDGSVTVTFPGAIKAKEGYLKEGAGDRCLITGKYRISKEAIEKAQSLSGKSYAFGDADVIITELAYEAYNAEVHITNYAMGQTIKPYIPGQECGGNRYDTLSFGTMHDATYILTGKKSELYDADPKKPRKLYISSFEDTQKPEQKSEQKLVPKINYLKSRIDEKEVTNIYGKDSDLTKLLDKCMGNEDKYAITVGFVCGVKDSKGKIKVGGKHALSVTKVTDKFVEVANPYNTEKKERFSREDFEKMAIKLNVAEI